MSQPSYAAVAAAAASVPCRILDDEELDKPPTFRDWREPAGTLAAQRIFGGTASASSTTLPRVFPAAFQSYRPERREGGFPFQSKPTARPARPAQRQGELQRRVQKALDASGTLTPLLGSASAMNEYPYAPTTPPGYSPKTPPWWDASGNFMGVAAATPPPLELSAEPPQ